MRAAQLKSPCYDNHDGDNRIEKSSGRIYWYGAGTEIPDEMTGDKSGRRFFAMRIAARGFLALCLFASCATALHAQTIQIELVNGKTGRPITDSSKLSVWITSDLHLRIVLSTDKYGITRLRLTNKDSEATIPDCNGKDTDFAKMNKKNKKEVAEFNRRYKYCAYFEATNPIVKYADSISIMTLPGDVSWKVGSAGSIGYVPCWESPYAYGMKDFSTEDIVQHGIVTANNCGKATASPQPGHLVLFVRLPTAAEQWRQAWN